MSTYYDSRFLQHIEKESINTIVEVGARYGDESLELAKIFKNAKIYSFECNPITVEECRKKLDNQQNINFFNFGLGDKDEHLPFYSFVENNDGASSLYKRIDFDYTQKCTGSVQIKTINTFVKDNNISTIDLLCMDIQGYELNVLKGAYNFIKKIRYIIMEEPKPIIDTNYLPVGVHSKYINAPSSQEIKSFMTTNGFYEIERIEENKIEDNVMYINLNLNCT
jgi:FkbM family methyltransferase